MNKKIFVLSTLTLIVIFWSFFQPGPRVASDYHFAYTDQLKSLFDLPFLWSTKWGAGLGYYVSTLWAWPLESLYGLLGNLGFSFALIERFLGPFLIVLVGFFGINKLLDYYKILTLGRLAAILFFLTNSYVILLIDGGQLNLATAYSVMPIAFYLYKRLMDKISLMKLVFFTFSILGISVVDLRICFLLAFLIGLNFLYDLILSKRNGYKEILKGHFIIFIFSLTFLILFNAYWILPIIFSWNAAFIPQGFSNSLQINFFSFSNISNGIFFQQPHWYKNNFGEIANINADFLLLPILILLAPILTKRDLRVGFWLVIAIFFIFLSKGTNDPLGGVNVWLFEKIPAFTLFRDPTKFFFIIALSYSILIGISTDEISKRLNLQKWYIKILLPLLIISYFLYLNKPVITMQTNGMFSSPVFEKEFFGLNNEIQNDSGFGRIVWINSKSPLGFESSDHPAVDAFGLLEKRPFATGTKGTYEKLNFLREATFTGQLLDVSGVASIIYPPLDYRKNLSADQIQYFSDFSNQLMKMPYVKERDEASKIIKLDLKQHQDRFFLTDNFWWVIGSDKLYEESTKSSQLNLSKNGLVFAEESSGLGEKILKFPDTNVLLLDGKTSTDFAASLLSDEEFIFPADKLKKDPDQTGWWKRETSDLIYWKDFLEQKYGIRNQDFDFGRGWAVAEGDLTLRIEDKNIKKDMLLLSRVLESTRSGEISFYQDNNLIGDINTNQKGDTFRWFEVGKFVENGKMVIKTKGDVNVINAIAITDETRWANLKNQSEKILAKQLKPGFDNKEEINKSPSVTYRRLNPTKYIVKINGLTKPQVLVFSEAYNPHWKIEGKETLPIFSLLNGFLIDKDGEYIISFVPQKYVYPGLLISALTLIILLILLVKTRND